MCVCADPRALHPPSQPPSRRVCGVHPHPLVMTATLRSSIAPRPPPPSTTAAELYTSTCIARPPWLQHLSTGCAWLDECVSGQRCALDAAPSTDKPHVALGAGIPLEGITEVCMHVCVCVRVRNGEVHHTYEAMWAAAARHHPRAHAATHA
ncbi:hypothetical protein EON67_00275 [archaeon]|nr:MAG: hypothetical protein EON67_00275 [archaeon]